ncbi:hypothetical protein ACB094_11G008700 [Castanea mollissima]
MFSEGLGKSQDWEMVLKYQRKNGSLFNSPSTTTAAFTHLKNSGCLSYLQSLLDKFRDAIPTVYPLVIYARLCMVDNLEMLGIDRHFRKEIRSVLDETYKGEEDIFLDTAICAMAFRMLRVNGYDVSSDPLTQLSEDYGAICCLGGYVKDIGAVLELFRAPEIIIHPEEFVLEKQNFLTSHFLIQESSSGSIHADGQNIYVGLQVDDALKFPYHANLDRISNRRAIEHYNKSNIRILKTAYSCLNTCNEDFLKLAVQDFNICQSIHREELKHIERCISLCKSRLDKLRFARQKQAYCYFSGAATFFSPELSDARMSWAKSMVLATVVDDFFDIGGSEEELVNLIQLVKNTACCSENVEIIFSALHSTICDIGDKAFTWQGHNVISHIIELWLDSLKSTMMEAEWSRDKTCSPTTLYFVGPKLSEKVVGTPEIQIHHLFELMSICGRLLNDIQGFKGKLNAVTLRVIHSGGVITEEKAVKEELLKLVLQEKSSAVPRACKDLFCIMTKVLHLFYMNDDGFTIHEMINALKAVIEEPIVLDEF